MLGCKAMTLRTMLYGSMSRSTLVCVSSSMDGIPDYLDYDDQINPRRHLGKTTAHPGQLCPGRSWLTVWVALVRGVLPIITKRVSIDPIVSTCRISPAVARRQDSVKDGGSVRIIKTRLVQPMRTCSHSRRQSRVRCLPPWPGPQCRLVSSRS